MKRSVVVFFCCAVVCLLVSASQVQAGGFALYEWSNRGVAMATTGYAVAGDASVVATNPALMTKLDGNHALAGVTVVSPQSTVEVNGHKNKTQSKIFAVPHAYYTRQLDDNENVWLGVGLFTRFGLGTYYDDAWNGRGELQYVEVKSQSLNPTMAFKLSDDMSFAFGVEILKGSFDLQREVGGSIASFHTSGYGVGGNIGLSYDITDDLTAGLTWRAPMELHTYGSAQINVLSLQSQNGQEISATLPGSYTLALGYKPSDKWNVEFDVIHTRWESVKEIKYGGAYDSATKLYYKNTWRFQVGGEYWFTDWLAGRLGYSYDQTPTRAGYASYMLPANDRMLYSTGLGFKWDKMTADVSFMYVTTKERTGMTIGSNPVNFSDGKTWITGLSLGYEF